MCDWLIRRRVLRECRRPSLAALIFARVAALIFLPLFQASLPCVGRPGLHPSHARRLCARGRAHLLAFIA